MKDSRGQTELPVVGRTPLMDAIMTRHDDKVLSDLLAAGADPFVRDAAGRDWFDFIATASPHFFGASDARREKTRQRLRDLVARHVVRQLMTALLLGTHARVGHGSTVRHLSDSSAYDARV